MFFQHYHVFMNLSKKAQCKTKLSTTTAWHSPQSFHTGLFQVGLHCSLVMGEMLWKSLHHFDITLYMSFPTIKPPRERDRAIMDIIFSQNLDPTDITRINRCRIHLQAKFLSDVTTADGTYLEKFCIQPRRSYSTVPIHLPTRATVPPRLGPMD
jgi:hypothetical protein